MQDERIFSETSSNGKIKFDSKLNPNANYNLFNISRGYPEAYSQEVGLNQIIAMISLAGMFNKMGIIPNNIVAEYDDQGTENKSVAGSPKEEGSLHCATILQHIFNREFKANPEITKFYTRGFGVGGTGNSFPVEIKEIDGLNIVYIAPYKYAGFYRTPAGAGYVHVARAGEFIKSPKNSNVFFSGEIEMPDDFNVSMNQIDFFAGEKDFQKTILSALQGLKLSCIKQTLKVNGEKIVFTPQVYTTPKNMLKVTDKILDHDKDKILLNNPFQKIAFNEKILAFSK